MELGLGAYARFPKHATQVKEWEAEPASCPLEHFPPSFMTLHTPLRQIVDNVTMVYRRWKR